MAIYSHSKLSLFEQCPLKYKFKYIDKLHPDIEQTIEGFLGSKVHETLEWIYKTLKKDKIPELDEVLENYISSWNKDYKKEIKIVREDLSAEYYFNQGVKFLIDYYLANAPFKDNTIATEMYIMIDLNNNGKYKIQGYIDRLVHNKESNIFEIHDYKTASFLKSQEELDKDRQLALYSIGIRSLYPDVKEVMLIWHFLAYNKKMISKRSFSELESLKEEIIKLIDKIESEKEFPPNPSCLCKWCEFQSYCIKKDEYLNLSCKNVVPDLV